MVQIESTPSVTVCWFHQTMVGVLDHSWLEPSIKPYIFIFIT